MADYHCVSTWHLQAPIEQVWTVMNDVERLPAWHPAIQEAQTLAAGDADGVGRRVRLVIKGQLPTQLAFEATIARLDPRRELEPHAEGELAGSGRWLLDQKGEITTVRYLWDVRTTRPWMNLVAPIARPLFTWNTEGVLLEAGRGVLATWRCRWWTLGSLPRHGRGPAAGMGGPGRLGRVVAGPQRSSASTARVMHNPSQLAAPVRIGSGPAARSDQAAAAFLAGRPPRLRTGVWPHLV
jgi:carbon monoxide dehydrogenase subunit G